MDAHSLKFIYHDAKGNVTFRNVEKASVTDAYVQGFCSVSNGFRTFRKDRILEYIEDLLELDNKISFYKNNPLKPPQKQKILTNDVCFTGFCKLDKDELIQIAKDNHLTIKGSVTKQLSFLCYGNNAGPVKMEKARFQGVVILNKDQFVAMLETGEIPEY